MLKIVGGYRIILRTGVLSRNLSTTPALADQYWREDHGLPTNPNSEGPLTNLPDYSFVDGRITPLGTNQKKRIQHQQEIARKMVTAIKELDYAKKRFVDMKASKEAEKKRIIENKLKPKGHLLLKKDK
ncbi:39S ribosomal protein L52, mitochondrial [Episyrphus balteatus]|uniref:39S ribosomal protein L52, mitochondrial n=1 Tax=Episyrphus balteatus TaxID=286459 RepID=UPI002484F195|nr:39S ribosomal protein L52, mitochondrial [Episyrphus balteatus]